MSVAGTSMGGIAPAPGDQSQSFWNYLYQLQLQSRLCDIELCIREMAITGEFVVSHSIPAHKLVVTGCSQFFRRCLQNGQLLDMYNFDGVQPQNLQTLIGYMYHQISWEVMMANPEAAEVAHILEVIPHEGGTKPPTQPKSPSSSNMLVVHMQDKNQAQLDEESLKLVKQAAIGGLGTSNPQPDTLRRGERVLIKNLQEELRKHNIGRGRQSREVVVLQPGVIPLQGTANARHDSPIVVPQVEVVPAAPEHRVAKVEVEPMSPVPDPEEEAALEASETSPTDPSVVYVETSQTDQSVAYKVETSQTDTSVAYVETSQTDPSVAYLETSQTDPNAVYVESELQREYNQDAGAQEMSEEVLSSKSNASSYQAPESHRDLPSVSVARLELSSELSKNEATDDTDADKSPRQVHNASDTLENTDTKIGSTRNIFQTSGLCVGNTPALRTERESVKNLGDKSSVSDSSAPMVKPGRLSSAKANDPQPSQNLPTLKVVKTPGKTEIIVIKPEKTSHRHLTRAKSPVDPPPLGSGSPYSTRYRGQKRVVTGPLSARSKRPRVEENPGVIDSRREQPDVIHSRREQPEVIHGRREQPEVIHSRREQSEVIHGQREQPDVIHGRREQPEVIHSRRKQPEVIHGRQEQGSRRTRSRGQFHGVDGTVDELVGESSDGSGPEAESQVCADGDGSKLKFPNGLTALGNVTDGSTLIKNPQDGLPDADAAEKEAAVKIKLEENSEDEDDDNKEINVAFRNIETPKDPTSNPQHSPDKTRPYEPPTDGGPPKAPSRRRGRRRRPTVEPSDSALPYACTQCDKRFKNSTGLSIHEQWKHGSEEDRKREGQGNQECLMCQKVCASYQALVQHMRMRHASNPVHQCGDCQEYFQNVRDYRSHRITAHGDVFYHCEICDLSFKSPEGHKIHMFKQHTEVEPSYMCTLCGKKFKMKHELSSHLRSTHAPDRAFKCQLCTRDFKNKGSLKRHLQTYHTDNKTIACPECYLLFKTKADMKAHLKKHFRADNPLPKDPSILPQEGPFVCEKCNKTFERKQQWQSHERQVHGEGAGTAYICTMCKKSYLAKNYLLAHIRQAHLPKRFKCPQCLYEFTHAYMIRKHMPKCRGSPVNLRPYKCNGCGKYFNLKGNLTRHIRSGGKCRGVTQTDTDYIVVVSNTSKYTTASVVERVASISTADAEVSMEALQASEALQQLQASGGPEIPDGAGAGLSDILEVDGEVPTDQLMDGDFIAGDLHINNDAGDLQKPLVAGQIHVRDDENLQETLAQISSLKDVISLPEGLRTMNVQKDEFGNIVIEVTSSDGGELVPVESLAEVGIDSVKEVSLEQTDSGQGHTEIVQQEDGSYVIQELVPTQEEVQELEVVDISGVADQ